MLIDSIVKPYMDSPCVMYEGMGIEWAAFIKMIKLQSPLNVN